MFTIDGQRTPGFKLVLAILVGLALTVPLVSIYLLNFDRQSQMRDATQSITAGWGASQTIAGPVLVIPYRATATETVVQNGQSVTRTNQVHTRIDPCAGGGGADDRPQPRRSQALDLPGRRL